MRNIVHVMLGVMLSVFMTTTVSAQLSPFSEDQSVVVSGQGSTDNNGNAPAPTTSVEDWRDTADGQAAYDQLAAWISSLDGHLQGNDYGSAGNSVAWIDRQLAVIRGRLNNGGVPGGAVQNLENRYNELKRRLNSSGSARLAQAARNHAGYSTARGPGGGNVACAWLVSIVLRSAGMVPAGWNDNVAPSLVDRLEREFHWQRVPANGSKSRGSLASSQMLPGDVVYFEPSEHVGIYVGDGLCLSNSSGSARARIHPVSGYYGGWVPRYVVRPPVLGG